MGYSEKDLDHLAELLWALPHDNFPMTLGELDGYLTGVLACPDLIPPSEWLPYVWGETGDAQFPDQKAAETTISAVMDHYNHIAMSMAASPWIEPIYEVDPNSDETLWEPWVDGFVRAMHLRQDAWQDLLQSADEEAQSAMIFILALQDIYEGTSKFSDDEVEEIDLEAPDVIPNCVAALLACARPELLASGLHRPNPSTASKRPGRNDPCPCGSGRKHKKCCGSA